MGESETSRGDAGRILIAEDSPTQAHRLRHMLERQGYEVCVATNGRLALEAAPQFRPELVISDVVMPEMGGYELCRRLKDDAELRHIPVVLVTTMSDPQDVISGLECGADNFVLKPYDESHLLNHVRYTLINRQMRQPQDVGMGVEIQFNGRRHFITADRLQILNLLLSTYDAAIQRNKELKHSQDSLEQLSAETLAANHFLQSVIDNIPGMLFVKQASDLTFVRLNRAGEELLGYPQADLLGKSDYDFFAPAEADLFVAKDRETLASGLMTDVEETIHTRCNGVRILYTRKIPIFDDSGHPQYLLGISDDVTEEKEREREILRLNAALEQRTAEAVAANRAKSTFLATMSHEIRTPINGIFGMLELLSLTSLDDEQRSTLAVVRQSGESLLRIIDDILDFSKVEAGMLEISPEAVSLDALVNDVFRFHSGTAQAKYLRYECRVDPRISPALLVDPHRLRQILNNFVSNALKFTTHGSIEIKADLIDRADGRDHVRLSVSDTGIGISKENQERLFQPFSQAESNTTRRFGGSGLGLVISRRLAELMGGSVSMVSELGKGTTLQLTLALPVAAPEPMQNPAVRRTMDVGSAIERAGGRVPSVEQARAQGRLILLVDDHSVNRTLLMRQVQTLGYAAESANDGFEALERWQMGRFGGVITDCSMPEMDGYELTRRIRQIEKANGGGRTPIIACTANAMTDEADACFAAGMDDYLVKPVALSELLEKLQRWLPDPDTVVTGPEQTDTPRPAAPVPDPVDRSVLADLLGGDEAFVRAILTDFRGSNDDDAATLERAVAANDLAAVERASHRVRGACKTIGAVVLTEICERIELASQAGDEPAIAAAIGPFRHELARLNAYLDNLQGSP